MYLAKKYFCRHDYTVKVRKNQGREVGKSFFFLNLSLVKKKLIGQEEFENRAGVRQTQHFFSAA